MYLLYTDFARSGKFVIRDSAQEKVKVGDGDGKIWKRMFILMNSCS